MRQMSSRCSRSVFTIGGILNCSRTCAIQFARCQWKSHARIGQMETRRMCPHCRAFITTSDRTCPYCNEIVGPSTRQRGSGQILGGFIPHAGFNTVLILLINFGLYAATAIVSMRSGHGGDAMNLDPYTLINFGAMFSPAIQAGQWWRIVTAGFLHGGLLHILMNSWALFDLGALVEEMYGASRMLTIYFVSNVSGFYL